MRPLEFRFYYFTPAYEQTVAFYRDVLGFEICPAHVDPAAAGHPANASDRRVQVTPIFRLLSVMLAVTLLSACSRPDSGEPKGGTVPPAPAASTPAPQASSPRPAAYPAGETFTGKPAAPILSGAEARRYRTIIQRDAAAGPNFAGHYTIVTWGCGSTCIGFAVVDARNGNVSFHPSISRAMQVPYQVDRVLQYSLDSRLLVIAGETEGPSGQSSTGKFYFEWKDDRFSQIARAEIQLEPGAPPLPPGTTLDDLCAGIDNSLACAREIERYQLQKADLAGLVKRSGAQLQLKLGDGRWLTVNDAADPADATAVIKYNFREHLPTVGYFLLHRQLDEGHGYLIVHGQTGRRYELHNVPVISPDRQRLVTASDGVTGGYSPNAVQIWRLSANGMDLEQTVEPKGWGPSQPVWLDDHTIRLTKRFPAGQGEARDTFATLKRNGKWQLQ